jgi:carbon storage regulator CsrA
MSCNLTEEEEMLVLSRRPNEGIVVLGQVTVTVVGVRGEQVRLGVEAPAGVSVRRTETVKAGALQGPPQPGQEPPTDRSLDLTDQLRLAIERDTENLNWLSMTTGIDRGRLSRFMRGERDLTLAAAAKLCKALGLELQKQPRVASG